MAEILVHTDISAPNEEGWTHFYRVLRADGSEVTVEAQCTRTAHETASAEENVAALEAMEDRAARYVLEKAELVQPPSQPGGLFLRVWFDVRDAGNPRCDVYYLHEL